MALDIKGLKRVFKLKKGNTTLTLDDPNSKMTLAEANGLLFHDLSGTDHGYRTRPEFEEDRGSVPSLKPLSGTKG